MNVARARLAGAAVGDVPKIPPEVAAAQAVLREIAAKGRDRLLVEGQSDAAIDAEIARAMKVMEAFLERSRAPAAARVHPAAAKAGGSKPRRSRGRPAQH